MTPTDTASLPKLIRRCAELADAELERRLDESAGFHPAVREACLYSVRAGGKRLRPALVMMAARACSGSDEPTSAVGAAAAAVEMIHTYSLIHDDLPAMDDDDLRRGKPTSHKVFGEAMAILAGDALLTRAFEVLAECVTDAQVSRRLIAELARAAGGAGMIAGQASDMLAERGAGSHDPVERRKLLESIHRTKTAALMRACLRLGAIAVGASDDRLAAVSAFGDHLGLAFQVVDDILDETSDAASLGKSPGKDKAAGKLTYPGLLGLDAARAEARRLTDAAVSAATSLGERGADLAGLAVYNLNRGS